jgi:hypothetical protein
MRSPLFAVLTVLSLLGCSARMPQDNSQLPGTPNNAPGVPEPEPGPKGPMHTAALWLPNRILDACDLVRAGVDVGPGIGFDGCVTHYMRIAGMARTSGGIGYQTFRHSPAKFAHEEYVISGPKAAEAGLGANWYHQTWDVRLELHLLLVGAHAAVNLGEIGDFLAGIVTLDPMDDDY